MRQIVMPPHVKAEGNVFMLLVEDDAEGGTKRRIVKIEENADDEGEREEEHE